MKKNIAFLLPSFKNGGAERVVSNLTMELSKEYCVYLILYDGSTIGYPYKGTLLDLKSIGVSKNPLCIIKNQLHRISMIKMIKRKYKINTTISFLEPCNIINIFSRCGDKIIVSVRNYKSKEVEKSLEEKIFKYFIRLFYNKADEVIALTEICKLDLVNNFNVHNNKIKVIYNPYNVDDIHVYMKEKISDEHKDIFNYPVIINAGRLTAQKGQWHMIRAFKKVKEKVPDAKLVFLGEGELLEYLEDLSRKLGLENDVLFLGLNSNPFKYFHNSSVFLLSSFYEGFVNVLAEAMACGIPVIAADCKSGPREILAPNTNLLNEAQDIEYADYGILVPVCDGNFYDYQKSLTREETILAESVISLFSNDSIRKKYSLASQERIKEFDISIIIRQWKEII